MSTLDAISAILHCTRQQFTGRLDIQSPTEQTWQLYFQAGRAIWVGGGQHPLRRWRRAIARASATLNLGATAITPRRDRPFWEYDILTRLYERQQLRRRDVQKILSQCVLEVMFDILQASQGMVLMGTMHPDAELPKALTLVKTEDIFDAAERQWQQWCEADLTVYSPNTAPVIANRKRLQESVPPKLYRKLVSLANSRHTLRDLSLICKQDLLKLTRVMTAHIRSGAMELATLPDIQSQRPSEDATSGANDSSEAARPAADAPLIMCVDDSLQNCKILEAIVNKAGYRASYVLDPLQAIPRLITEKPDFIFLDLMMPVVNGYEVCAQIKRVSQLKDVPVVFLTSQDGLGDRMRAKLVRASGFLSKPIESDKVLSVVRQHLKKIRKA